MNYINNRNIFFKSREISTELIEEQKTHQNEISDYFTFFLIGGEITLGIAKDRSEGLLLDCA